MEKKQRWRLAIILAVLIWTLYSIFPTIIYYSRPLNQPVDEKGAKAIEVEIAERVNSLVPEAEDWIRAFCKSLGVHPSKISVDPTDSSIITFDVASPEEASLVQKFLPRAGLMVPFKPAQIFLDTVNGKSIRVNRHVSLTMNEKDPSDYFSFLWKRDKDGRPTEQYVDLVVPRFVEVAYACSGSSPQAEALSIALQKNDTQALEKITADLSDWKDTLSADKGLTVRLLQSLFSGSEGAGKVDSLITKLNSEAARLGAERTAAQAEQDDLIVKDKVVPATLLDRLNRLTTRVDRYSAVSKWLASQKSSLTEKVQPFTREELQKWVRQARVGGSKTIYTLPLGNRNPLIHSVSIDWTQDQIRLTLHPDIADILLDTTQSTEKAARLKDGVSAMVMNDIARISRQANETLKAEGASYAVSLSRSPLSNSLIALKLDKVASSLSTSTLDVIAAQWEPQSIDLVADALPRLSAEQYRKAPQDIQKLSLLVFSPASTNMYADQLKSGSLYVILRGGIGLLTYKRGEDGNSQLEKDLDALTAILERRGFVVYSGKALGPNSEFANDIIFELDRFYQPLLEATREAFYVPGVDTAALLECGTWEQRILAENHIDDSMQEDLVKWAENYQASQVSLQPADRYSVPPPTRSLFWSNLKRSWRKYWRGDDSRIIRWGLDLSGGKSVRVGLLDQANRPVTKMDDLKQATSELYSRLNKMGVSERTLRIENGTILIDFPGVQGVSASELVKASAMYFHVVNEKFGQFDSDLAKPVNAFLQEVWNEAVVTNCKDSECVNKIALRRISAVKSGLANDQNIKALLDAGLVLEDPTSPMPSTAFDDHVSILARWNGDDPAEWPSHTHPLMIVFKNYALEGCNLENVHPSYDSSKGNILLFGVRNSDARRQGLNPRDEFYTWTSQFSEEGIVGTPREQFSRGRGWRMAVILNGTVVNAPSLSSALRDSAMITGNFSQREVQRLATNLQAGSLSFTPKILSEQNVSPELGVKERHQGLVAAALATIAVVGIMVGYYRFAGAVASVAVLFNLLIIWAVMQNIEAAMTLPAIAGIVLTVAMAVDANVLVFERIREEFLISNRIASAIARGYQKAFSAITDSNLTTLIAAFILTQFDCGPVRGFAMTLIIGLISSMFTSLFVTRYYFTGWAEKPEHTRLTMSNWIKSSNFDFLAWKKVAYIASAAVLIIGIVVGGYTWKSMLGMDFTGGYALVLETSSTSSLTPRELAEKALEAKGLQPSEIQIRELGRPTALRIQLSASLEQSGRPFSGLPEAKEAAPGEYEYQTIPRLAWVISALEQGGLTIRPADRAMLVQQWTAISGQFSDAMRNNALLALGLSLVAILIYIAVRFEWKYAISAVLALIHDVLLTLAVLAILRLFGLPVQINLEVIGALMTIIGYSLNDTIIVFDRVREDIALYHKKRFSEIVNMALNSTLSRTLLTSGITLVVLLCLVLLGGPSIFGFSFVMFLGVFLGTISSLFIAGPLLVFFHQREDQIE
jgi:SecD/SecF fusion protein